MSVESKPGPLVPWLEPAPKLFSLGESYPKDIPDVLTGLQGLSQSAYLATLDELMSRRGHNRKERAHLVNVWRMERTSWKDARDARADRKEAEESE